MLIDRSLDAPVDRRSHALAALALLSLAAGFLHAAVVNPHRGHGIAAGVFTALAVVQVAWAGLVMIKPTRLVLALGAVINAAVVGGYLISRTTGIGFMSGFEDKEPVAFTDAVTTGLELALVIGAVLLLRTTPDPSRQVRRLSTAGLAAMSLAVAFLAVPAAAGAPTTHAHSGGDTEAAGGRSHGGGSGGSDHHGGGEQAAGHHAGGHTDPEANVTPEQRAAAERLLADVKDGLWQWNDPAKVHEVGFRTIGDSVTGTEHLVNWRWIVDDKVLDPNRPESLVFRPTPEGRVLEAAMFMVPPGTADEDLPDVGGTLTQWHIHDNLCMSPERMSDGAPQRTVAGLTNDEGGCDRGEKLPNAQMLHVWVVDHPCGPFSSLEGVGAGQAVKETQDPNADPDCDHSEH